MAAYLGSLLLFFMGFFVASFLLFSRGLGTLLDPIGIRFIVEDIAHLWTTTEKSWRLLALEGIVLTNRLLWVGVALGVLAVTYLSFRFAHRTESAPLAALRSLGAGLFGRLRRGRRAAPAPDDGTVRTPLSVPQAQREPALRGQATTGIGITTRTRQTLAIAWESFRAIATSWPGLALLVVIPLLTVPVVLDQMVSSGVPLVPTTPLVISELTAPLSAELSRWVIIPLLLVFFAGELVWRERDAGLAEIVDAVPVPEWGPLLGKLLGLGLLLVIFMALLTAAGGLAQGILGYQEFETGLYLKTMFGLQLSEYLLFAVLALVVHVLVDQKYIGHLMAVIVYAFITLAGLFGVEHDLLIYGAGPGWSYTDMRGFGPSLAPWLWFKLYWAAWALVLVIVARLLWVRGREEGLRVRLQGARHRLTRPTMWTAAAALGLILTLGGFIFCNTNVLNEYLTTAESDARRAEYERRYGRYASIPQPHLARTTLHVEIYPEQREVDIQGRYHLVNRSDVALATIHLATVPGVESGAVTLDRLATLQLADDELGHRIYALREPLQPGDSLRLDFEVQMEPHGFRESGADAAVVENGTYFTNADWLPAIGYQRQRELTSASDRRAHGLASRPVIPSLYDEEARMTRAEGATFEAVIGTTADQIAIAPGALRQTWTESGRRYFRYATDVPIGNEWAFSSADYAMHESTWSPSTARPGSPDSGSGQTITIQVFHHPEHTAHLERMLRSVRASLDHYTQHFGPYALDYLSIIERPGMGTGMHADAGMITHEEGFTFWNPRDGVLDLPSAVVAHEVAHQWTVPYASVEGAPVMSESLAWYYAMQVVRESFGELQLQRLLSFMRQPYPIAPIRRGEPLLRGLAPYLAYRKGPFALHALSQYAGTDRVNTALRRLIEQHGSGTPPLPTTLDLYRELQAVTPDRYQSLLHDLFEVNAFWELETEHATAVETDEGTWQVSMDLRGRKVGIDETGVETEVPMDDWIEIGVFGPAVEGDGALGDPLYRQQHRLRSGEQTVTVEVPGQPALAGIDPYGLLTWEEREEDDNVARVSVRE